MLALVAFSRLGVYARLPGVDVDAFSASLAGGGLLGYIDALSGGSISRVGIFSLGIVPYINASIVLQLLATAFPSLKKLQREEGPQGQARFQLYQKLLALAFAGVQAAGQLTYVRPYVDDWSPAWAAGAGASLVAGAMILVYVADTITDLKVGNGTSVLITANIASSLPTSVGAAITQAAGDGGEGSGGGGGATSLGLYAASFLLTTLGVVYVQEAERKIPMNYASRYRNSALARQSYLPFKVNATGVMPVIFASTLLALPAGLARYAPALEPVADAVGQAPFAGHVHLLVNNASIAYKGDAWGGAEAATTVRTNYFGTKAVTDLLLPCLAPPARIVTVASRSGAAARRGMGADVGARFDAAATVADVDALAADFCAAVADGSWQAKGWPRSMYGVSKLCQIAWTRVLNDDLKRGGRDIVATACCPGSVATAMSSYRGSKTPAEGADTPVWLATEAAGGEVGGRFFGERTEILF
jgi:preprotein translocase subunit SecY